jgi:hypothetical protein
MHLLCWALESWFGNQTGPPRALVKLSASFDRGVLVGETVHAAVVKGGENFTVMIRRDQATMLSIRGELGPPVAYGEALPPLNPTRCRVIDFAAASEARGALALSYSATRAGRLFPQLSAALPAWQVAALLATTRLVGMECPGLHSLYSAMNITFDRVASGAPEMNFHVESADPRFGLLRLAVRGPGFHGRLTAFVRPAPCRQAGIHELARLVERGEFAGQRAVVIGGSRGLGEVTAKLLAVGGAEVMVTYYCGKEDAEAVAAEIRAGGGQCRVVPFDATRPTPVATMLPPTHLYYFATPHIDSDKTVVFSSERFAEYCRYYVTGFVQTLLQVAQGAPTLEVLYPSTAFLDEPAHMAEYCAAKAAGEEVCRQLASRLPAWHIQAPRLPRMLTDQNSGLLPVKTDAPEIVILPHLRGMNQSLTRH